VTTSTNTGLVAIVDDDQSVQNALKDLMESVGISARCFGSAQEFLASHERDRTACLIVDIRMPGMSGLEMQARLKAEGSFIPIIFMTAHNDSKTKMQAIKAGAIEFLSKPFDDEVLLEKVRLTLGM
jgi:FixJ family two-component response regulator